MQKRIAVLIRAGLPFRSTILYGRERAKETGAKMRLIGVIPKIDHARRVSLAMFESCSYDLLMRKQEEETVAYLERAIQFCLDHGITVESEVVAGGLDNVAREVSRDRDTKLLIIPSPTKDAYHHEFISTLKHFAHDIFDCEPACCPVVSVLATG